jgi:hypothetical protein
MADDDYESDNEPKEKPAYTKVDTTALLGKIHDLELSLTEYHRQDKIPEWAQGVIQRLETAEKLHHEQQSFLKSEQGSEGSTPVMPPRPMGPGIGLDDLAKEDRIFSKFKAELNLQLSSSKLALESKVSSTSLELDRLHKLLQIRPTTSDLQQVITLVHDLNRQMEDNFRDVGTAVKSVVTNNISVEMKSIMKKLDSNEEISEKGFLGVSEKVDSCQTDINGIRLDFDSNIVTIKGSLTKASDELASSDHKINNLKKQVEEDAKNTTQKLVDLKLHLNIASETLSDYRLTIFDDLKNMNISVDKNEIVTNDMIKTIETRDNEAKKGIAGIKKVIDDFRNVYDLDVGTIRKDLENSKNALAISLTTQNEIASYIAKLQAKKVFGLVEEHEERLKKNTETNLKIDQSIVVLNKKNKSLSNTAIKLEDRLQDIPNSIDEQKERIIALNYKNEEISNALSDEIEKSLTSAHFKITNLSSLKEEVDSTKNLTAATEERMRAVQSTFKSLIKINEEHDERIEQVIMSIHKSEEQSTSRMDEVRQTIMDNVEEKNSEIDAAITNMQDNLEAVSDPAPVVVPPPAVIESGGVNSNPGSKPTTAITSVGSRPSTSGGLLSSRIGNDEASLFYNSYQFIVDLCVNFEEISVRKSSVPDLPPTMCEHLTSTAQLLCSNIASSTDAEMVQQILRSGPEIIDYEEDAVSEKRQAKLLEIIMEIVKMISLTNSQPGIIRLEAREKFIKQLRKGLQLCMSKHDQVLIVGNSKLGKVKVPSCIACDRPLLERVREDSLARSTEKTNISYFGGGNSRGGTGIATPQFNEDPKGVRKLGKKGIKITNSLKLLVPRTQSDE